MAVPRPRLSLMAFQFLTAAGEYPAWPSARSHPPSAKDLPERFAFWRVPPCASSLTRTPCREESSAAIGDRECRVAIVGPPPFLFGVQSLVQQHLEVRLVPQPLLGSEGSGSREVIFR